MAETFDVHFQTTADTAGAAQTTTALNEVRRVTKELEREAKEASDAAVAMAKQAKASALQAQSEASSLDAFTRSGGSQSRAAAAAEEMQRVFGDFGGTVKTQADGAGASLMALGTKAFAVVGGFTALKSAVSASLAEFSEKEQEVAKLDAALAALGGVTDEYREKLLALSETLQEQTTIGAPEWLTVITKLTQYGANESNIGRLAEGVKNLAGLMGGDIHAAGNVMARALQGSFEMLSRYGIHVEEAGSQTDKLNQLLEMAAQRGAGQLSSQLNTLEGKSRMLGHAWGGLKESIGTAIAPAAKGAIDTLTSAVNWLNKALFGTPPAIDVAVDSQRELEAATVKTTNAILGQVNALTQANRISELRAEQQDKEREAIAKKARAENEVADAQLAADEAAVGAAEAQGQITPEQAEVARENLRSRAAKEKHERDQRARMEEQVAIEMEQRRMEDESHAALERAQKSGTEEDMEEARKIGERNDARRPRLQERHAELQDELEQADRLFPLQEEARRTGAVGGILGDRRREAEKAAKEPLGKERAEALGEARSIADDAGGLKGRSPEATARLEKAAEALKDGASSDELDSLNQVLDKVAEGLEKLGKNDQAKAYRELQNRVNRLEGIVSRLESTHTGTGS